MSEKLTEWFAPDAKPMREGVYELDWEDTDGRCFCKWFGSGWGDAKWVGLSGNGSIEMAIIKADRSEIYSDMAVRWRGLAEEPK